MSDDSIPEEDVLEEETLDKGLYAILYGTFILICADIAVNLLNEGGLTALDIVLNGFASLGLLYIYIQMYSVQSYQRDAMEQQTKTMIEQEKWMKSRNEPDIRILDDARLTGEIPPRISEEDYLAVQLENTGTGAAKQIKVRCDIYCFDCFGESLKRLNDENSVFSIDGWEFYFKSNSRGMARNLDFQVGQYSLVQSVRGETLQSGEIDWFFSQIWVMCHDPNGGGRSISFTDSMMLLWAAGVSKAAFCISVIYEDMNENVYADIIHSGQLQLDESIEFGNIVPSGFGVGINDVLEEEREKRND